MTAYYLSHILAQEARLMTGKEEEQLVYREESSINTGVGSRREVSRANVADLWESIVQTGTHSSV